MQEKNEFNSFSLINYVWQWRKLFLIVCGTTAVLAFFFSTSWFIKPQYKATTVIYAPRTNSVSKIINNDNGNEKLDIKAYAMEDETEQMMQILNSREIKDILIERYDLVNYYGLGKKSRGWQTKLYETLEGFIDIQRTKYGAISITVTDWNPEQAAKIANDIVAELDILKNKIEYERARIGYEALEIQLIESEQRLQRMTDTLSKFAQRGVYLFEAQAERVIQQYAIALAQGNTAGVQRLQNELVKLEKWGLEASALKKEQTYVIEYITWTRQRMFNARMDMETHMPTKFVLEKAIAPDKKSYPKKLIIALTSTIGAFFLLLMILLFMDKIKQEIVVEKE